MPETTPGARASAGALRSLVDRTIPSRLLEPRICDTLCHLVAEVELEDVRRRRRPIGAGGASNDSGLAKRGDGAAMATELTSCSGGCAMGIEPLLDDRSERSTIDTIEHNLDGGLRDARAIHGLTESAIDDHDPFKSSTAHSTSTIDNALAAFASCAIGSAAAIARSTRRAGPPGFDRRLGQTGAASTPRKPSLNALGGPRAG